MRPLGLLLLTGAFLTGGWGQLRAPTPRAEQARRIGLPVPDGLVQMSGLMMIAGSLGLQFPPVQRLAALWLALQLVPITYLGHRYWELDPGPARAMNEVNFFKNVSLIGAGLAIAGSKA